MTAGPRYGEEDGDLACLDCGVVVANREAHTRFHSIMSSWAWMLAVLKTSHVAAHIHDQYDAVERIDRRKFDNWSADALAEVTADMGGKSPMPDWTVLHDDDAEENRALLELRDGDVLRVFRYRRDKATGKEAGYVQDLPSIQGAFATPAMTEDGP